MSGHLIGCVKDVTNLGKSHKLALVAFADSADDRTHIGFAGYEGVMAWASCSRSRAAELIGDLVTSGYLHPHKRARPGRRAEYVVFPQGCCDVHRTPESDPDEVPIGLDVEQLVAMAQAGGMTVEPWQVRALAERLGQSTTPKNGSEFSDPSGGDRSENSDLLRDRSGNGSENSDLLGQRVQNGSETLDPFTTTTTTPPSPRKRGAVSTTTCQKHGTTPVDNCRGCRTTPRQITSRLDQEADQRRRQREADDAAADRARRAQRPDRKRIRQLITEAGLR